MFNIGEYLKKFKELSSNNTFLKEKVIEALLEIVKINIESKDITFKETKAIIKCRPIIKNEIAMKKERVLSRLLETAGGKIKEIILS